MATSAHWSALAPVYFCKRHFLQLVHSLSVNECKQKFTNVYPSRGGVSKLLPVRSAASRPSFMRCTLTNPDSAAHL